MRVYLIIMVMLAVLAGILATPNAALILAVLTLGLGFPLLFAVTVLAYGACLFPLFAMWHVGGATRLAGAVISLAALACLAYAPGYLGEEQARAVAAAITSTDIQSAAAANATSLEIRRRTGNDFGYFADSEPCGTECRALLLGGKVEWVRVVMTNGGRDKDGRRSGQSNTFHVAAHGDKCAVPGSAASASEACVLMEGDNGKGADLVISIADGSVSELAGAADTMLYEWAGWGRVSAFLQDGQSSQEVYRRTEADIRVAETPLVLAPYTQGMSSDGYEIWRTKRRFNAISLASALSAVGLNAPAVPGADPQENRPKSWEDGISDAMTRDVIAVLDLPGDALFNAEQSQVISQWVMHARKIDQWTPDLIALLQRIAGDRRLRTSTYVDQIVTRHPEIANAILPPVFDVMEAEGLGRDYNVARQVAYRLPNMDQHLIAPYAARIIALLGRDQRTKEILLRSIGRIGVDPTPYLLPISDDLDAQEPLPRIRGACYADRKWASLLIPPLRAAFKEGGGREGHIRGYRENILRALANLGDMSFVEEQLAHGPIAKREHLRTRIAKYLNDKKNPDRLCAF